MKRAFLVVVFTAMLLAVLAVLGGCTPGQQAARPDTPGFEVRIPPAESPDVRMRAEQPVRLLPEPPSVSDEYRGRWLTLFEVTVTPPTLDESPRVDEGP